MWNVHKSNGTRPVDIRQLIQDFQNTIGRNLAKKLRLVPLKM